MLGSIKAVNLKCVVGIAVSVRNEHENFTALLTYSCLVTIATRVRHLSIKVMSSGSSRSVVSCWSGELCRCSAYMSCPIKVVILQLRPITKVHLKVTSPVNESVDVCQRSLRPTKWNVCELTKLPQCTLFHLATLHLSAAQSRIVKELIIFHGKGLTC